MKTPLAYTLVQNDHGSASGFGLATYVFGIYVVDISGCTKNIANNNKRYDIILTMIDFKYGLPRESNGNLTQYAQILVCPIFGYLNALDLSRTTIKSGITVSNCLTTYSSTSKIAECYGCSTDHIKVYSQDQFNTWFEQYLIDLDSSARSLTNGGE